LTSPLKPIGWPETGHHPAKVRYLPPGWSAARRTRRVVEALNRARYAGRVFGDRGDLRRGGTRWQRPDRARWAQWPRPRRQRPKEPAPKCPLGGLV